MLDQIINKINKQDYENAQKDLKKIITTDSSNSKAFYLLGIINLKINNIEEAIEYFQKALALNQSIEYLFAYSEALIKNNLFVEAQNSYKKILNIDNKNEPAIVNLAYSYLLTYNYSEAEAMGRNQLLSFSRRKRKPYARSYCGGDAASTSSAAAARTGQ